MLKLSAVVLSGVFIKVVIILLILEQMPKIRQIFSLDNFPAHVIWGCITLYVATLVLSRDNIGTDSLQYFLSPTPESVFVLGATGAIPVFQFGCWWTIFSSGWLHGSLLHITFNMLWVQEFAPRVGQMYGFRRLVIIYTVSIGCGSLLTSIAGRYFEALPTLLQGSDLAIGASGGIFGLCGALIAAGQIIGDTGMRQKYFRYAVAFFLFSIIVPRVDNWGHLGGFLGGYGVSYLPWLDPRNEEGKGHLLGAIACLIIFAGSIALSVRHGLL